MQVPAATGKKTVAGAPGGGDKVILAKVGESLFSFHFSYLEEVVGPDRVVGRKDLPPGVAEDRPASEWVAARGEWFPVMDLGAGMAHSPKEKSQYLLVRKGGEMLALRVDQVLGFERLPSLIPTPPVLAKTLFIPLAGFRIRKGRVVLELDLSRPIE